MSKNEHCVICRIVTKKQLTTYTQWYQERLIVIENVPARVCEQCGETYYDPDVVEQVQVLIWADKPPKRLLEAPVYDLSIDGKST